MVEITLKTDMEKQSNSEVDWIFFLKLGWSQKFLETFLSSLRVGDKIQVPFINKSTFESVKAPYLFLKPWDLASA